MYLSPPTLLRDT